MASAAGAAPVSELASELRVVLADDQTVVREGLATLLGLLPGITVVGTAPDGGAAVALVAEHAPDVLLTDLRMPVLDGVGATRRVRAEHPGTAVVVLTTYAEDAAVLDALRAGAMGWLSKDASAEAIARALRTAQEALSNARKHTPGAPVTVRLSRLDGRTELEVRDRAGAPPVRGPGGYGLVGMAERAALAGGELDVGPTEDGWRVRLVLPR
jgi:CheY-like chemotaxis protein